MTPPLELWLPGRPVPWSRTAHTRSGRRYNPAVYATWLNNTRWAIREHISGDPIEGPVALAVVVHPDGLAVTVTELDHRARPVGIRGDLDNYYKASGDVLERAGVIADDRQVEAMLAGFDDRPGTPDTKRPARAGHPHEKAGNPTGRAPDTSGKEPRR